jgi:hypothetical protein
MVSRKTVSPSSGTRVCQVGRRSLAIRAPGHGPAESTTGPSGSPASEKRITAKRPDRARNDLPDLKLMCG